LNPDYYVAKAHKAILTNQPNLAMLYMNRGMQILDQRRREHLMGSIEGRFILLGEDVNAMAEAMVKAFAPAMDSVVKAFESFHVNLLEAYDQEFYALVSE
jgi:hypothetical protein